MTRIYALISILALILIGLLVPTMGGKGMIYAVVIPEVIALFQLGIYSIKIEKESQGIFPIR